MKKLLIGSAGVIFILGVGLSVLPTLIPSSVYKDKIESELSRELARDVRVLGDVKLSIFPVIKANTGRVEIDNPEGFSTPQFAAMDAMSARVKLLPLFSKRVEITSFTLKNPTINLEKTTKGDVNWAFGEGEAPEEIPDAGPFKRDGRYANLDPSIGNFTLQNGQISYIDRTTNANHSLEKVNIDFILTGLSDPLEVAGDFVYNGMAADVDIAVESLRNFLDGKDSPVSAKLKTEFANINAKGRLLAGQDIAFNLDVTADVSEMKKLLALSPTEIKYAELIQMAKLSGNYNFDGTVISAKGADISAQGPTFDAAFTGNAVLADTPVLNGVVRFKSQNVADLANALELKVDGLNLINVANVTADLSALDKGFRAQNVNAEIKGTGLDGNFSGAVNYADTITAEGNFTAKVTSVPALVKALELDLPQASAVESLDISGAVDYSERKTILSNIDVSTAGGPITGTYKGTATLAEAIGFAGDFTGKMSSLSQLSARTGIEIPYAEAIGIIDLSGAVSGEGETLSVTGLSATLKDGLLNGNYTGNAALSNGVSLDGRLNVNIPSLRKLAVSTGVNTLPPSTDEGQIYEEFSVAGTVKGTPDAINFSGAEISLDAIKATGDFVVNTKLNKPHVTATLSVDELDLNPYMAAYSAQNPTGKIQPWSEEPLNFTALNAVDGDFTMSALSIRTGRVTMGKSDINAKLRSGVLTADLPNMALYGGSGRMLATVDASSPLPTVSLDMGLTDLGGQGFLGAVAGFTNATGTTGTSLKINGKGRTQAEIMKSLSGQGDFKMVDGKISGIDLQMLMSGLDQALATRSLPGGIGAAEVTKFKNIIGMFQIENGVASVQAFSLEGFGVLAEGGGAVNLGSQNIDFSLRPRLTGKSASDLAAFGIPIRVQGGFGDVKIGLDTDLVAKIAAERARVKAGSFIEKEVGGTIGGILGGVIGGQKTPEVTVPSQDPAQSTEGEANGAESAPVLAKPTPKEQAEDKAEEAVKGLIGGIFGGKNTKSRGDEAPVENKKDE